MKKPTVVDRALAKFEGSQARFARELSKVSGEDVSRQRVFGWYMRGTIPRDMLVHVETLCGIPLEELIQALPRNRDDGNIVDRAIRLLGAGAEASTLARELSKISGRRITRQMVNNWQLLEQFPVDIVPYVHVLVRIPVKEMLEGRRVRKRARLAKRETREPGQSAKLK